MKKKYKSKIDDLMFKNGFIFSVVDTNTRKKLKQKDYPHKLVKTFKDK